MTTFTEIPLKPTIPQQFGILLSGTRYVLTFAWRDVGGPGWVMDIADTNNSPLASGIPLVGGVDLLGQLRYLGIPGSLMIATDGQDASPQSGAASGVSLDPPTRDNLGVGCHLYYVTP